MYYRNQPYPFPQQNQQMTPYHFPNQFQYPYSYYAPFQTTYGYQYPNQWQNWGQSQGQQNPQQPPTQQENVPSPMSFFTGSDGSFDFQKAINSFDQFMKTANQVSPLMKQLGSLFTPKK